MIETVISLVPTYGLYLLFGVVLAACLAVPLPASMVVLTSGSFAAAGEMALISVLAATFVAYVAGDQLAYGIARSVGPGMLSRFKKSPRTGPILERSEKLLQKRGASAVFLSHTIVSPTCPYISYLSGAGGLNWAKFVMAAIPGAAIWTGAYVGLGYMFAGQLETVAETLSHFFGFVLAGAVVLGCLILVRSRWRAMRAAEKAEDIS